MLRNTRREVGNSNHRLIYMGCFDMKIDYYWALMYGFSTTPNYEFFCGCSHWFVSDPSSLRPSTDTIARFQAGGVLGGSSYSGHIALPGVAFVHIYDGPINEYNGAAGDRMRENDPRDLVVQLRREARQDWGSSSGYGFGSITTEVNSDNGCTSGNTGAAARLRLGNINTTPVATLPSFGTSEGALLMVAGDIMRGIEIVVPPTAFLGHNLYTVVAFGFVSHKKFSPMTDTTADVTMKCVVTMISDHTHQITTHPQSVRQESGTTDRVRVDDVGSFYTYLAPGTTVNAQLVSGQNSVRLDPSFSTVKLDAAANTVKLDASNNSVKIDAAGNVVKLDSSSNTVKLDPSSNTVKVDSTVNTVKLAANGNIVRLDPLIESSVVVTSMPPVALTPSGNTVQIDPSSNVVTLDSASTVNIAPDQEIAISGGVVQVFTPFDGPALRVQPDGPDFAVTVNGGVIQVVTPADGPPIRVQPDGGTLPISAPAPIPVTTQIEALDEEGLPVDVDTNFSANVRGVAAVANVVPLSVTAPLSAPLMVATPPDFFMPVVNPVFPSLGHDGLRPRPVPLVTEPARDFSVSSEPYITQPVEIQGTNPGDGSAPGLVISGVVDVRLTNPVTVNGVDSSPLPVDISPGGVLNAVRTVPIDTWIE